jgi:hypothetical protein
MILAICPKKTPSHGGGCPCYWKRSDFQETSGLIIPMSIAEGEGAIAFSAMLSRKIEQARQKPRLQNDGRFLQIFYDNAC